MAEGEQIVLPPADVPDTAEFQRNSTNEVCERKFIFAEFFCGMGGFSEAVKFVGGDRVTVIVILDGYSEEWNILEETDFKGAVSLCEDELDHGHFAPPCRTLTKARRNDQYGEVPTIRSEERPEGWGDPQAEEANEIIRRMVLLCMMLHKRGATFAIENPWESNLWLLKVIQRLLRLTGAELILLHQCTYGASSMKPTGILTTAPWMKLVRRLCGEVRDHVHTTVFVGKAWGYVTNAWVWRTSLAAEYPCGLCLSWSKALRCWLNSSLGKRWLQQRSYKLVGK